MRIGIDMFAVQAPLNRGGGIGRYTEGLLRTLLADRSRIELFLYFFAHLPFDSFWEDLIQPPHQLKPIHIKQGVAEALEWLVSANPDGLDQFLVTNPMEQHQSYRPPPRPVRGLRLAALFHDLIPVVFQEHYLAHETIAHRYRLALDRLTRYDLLLCISEATRKDALRYLPLPPERVVTIGSASDTPFFTPQGEDEDHEDRDLVAGAGVARPFVFSVGGPDMRKNLQGLLQAYALLPRPVRLHHQLVLSCRQDAATQAHFQQQINAWELTEEVVLTGFVSDEVLRALYRQCKVFVSPSLYEGGGLPILEAMLCGAPVIAGNTSAQTELVKGAGLLVDPLDPPSLSARLFEVLEDQPLASQLRRQSLQRGACYSWADTSSRARAALLDTRPVSPASGSPGPTRQSLRKPPLAVFAPLRAEGPLPDLFPDLLQELAVSFAIDLYHENRFPPMVPGPVRAFDVRLFTRRDRAQQYPAVLYDMGAGPEHRFVYEALESRSGVVLLRDHDLTDFHLSYATLPQTAPDHLARQVAIERGEELSAVQDVCASWQSDPEEARTQLRDRRLYLNHGVAELACGVILPDEWSRRRFLAGNPHLADRLTVIPPGCTPRFLSPACREEIRQRHDLSTHGLVVVAVGPLGPAQCLVEVLAMYAPLAHAFPDSCLLLIGPERDQGATRALVEELDIGRQVRFISHSLVPETIDLLPAADVALHLRRPPTTLEHSASLVTLLGVGVPAIVAGSGIFTPGAFPGTIVLPCDEDLVRQGTRALFSLATSPERRARLSQEAMQAACGPLSLKEMAARITAFVQQRAWGKQCALPPGAEAAPCRLRLRA
jgi:glycosyltransferase involved in cell wall biosynthesis